MVTTGTATATGQAAQATVISGQLKSSDWMLLPARRYGGRKRPARKDVANVEFDCKVTAVRYSNEIEIAGAEHVGPIRAVAS